MLRSHLVAVTALALVACGESSERQTPPTDARVAAPPSEPEAKRQPPWWEGDAACSDGAALERPDERTIRCMKEEAPHGRSVELHEGGAKRTEGRYVEGKRDGIWSQWSATGELLGTFSMSRGTGTVLEWYDNGDAKLEASYKDGALSGPYREWYESRKLKWQRAYAGGVPVGGWQQWSRGGELLGSLSFKNGSGAYAEWNEDGSKSIEGAFRRGKYHGRWILRWSVEDGGKKIPIEYRRTYRDGRVIALRLFRDGKEVRDSDDANKLMAGRPKDRPTNAPVLLGTLSGPSVFGTDVALGSEVASALGNLTGNQVGEAGGLGVGTGAVRGGSGIGTIGTGGLGTRGTGAGGGGIGLGTGGLGTRRGGLAPKPPAVRFGSASVSAGLDKAIVARVLRRHINGLRACYQRELQRIPSLAGTVTVGFTIGPKGEVISAKANGMGNAVVEGCVARRFKRMIFPQPQGGGLVKVSAPVTFAFR